MMKKCNLYFLNPIAIMQLLTNVYVYTCGKVVSMKYNLENKTNRFAQRTLKAFSDTLFYLLEKKPFEEITVNELCKVSNYPRATFYNYFEDIYDLLNYCWLTFSKEIHLEEYISMKPEDRIYEIFDRIYDFMESKRNQLNTITKLNLIDGDLSLSFQKYLRDQVRLVMDKCDCTQKYSIPYEVVANHYSNTLLMMIEWCFLKKNKYSKKQAKECLEYLLNGI